MSDTSTSTLVADNVSVGSHFLGSINQSSKRSTLLLSKTYEVASSLFLTRQLSECLQRLDTVLTSAQDEGQSPAPALIATARKSTRIKVWSLYLSLLDAIIKLGPDDGKNQFGSKEWRSILSKVRDGTIWEEVVQTGYGGDEGRVDMEVVCGLATLLLAHSSSQVLNQQRLEAYLSLSSQPSLDLSDRFETSSPNGADLSSSRTSTSHVHGHTNGTDTPRALNARIKILELYTLHVLPRNEEWEYAGEFISMSEILDEDRREAFLQTLHSLEEQHKSNKDQEASILRQRDEELQQQRQADEARHAEMQRLEAEAEVEAKDSSSRQHQRNKSEQDYGIEDPNPGSKASKQSLHRSPTPPLRSALARPSATSGGSSSNGRAGHGAASTRARRAAAPTASVYRRGMAMLATMQRMLLHALQSTSRSPLALLRTLLFLLLFLLAASRRDVRERLARTAGVAWQKLRATVGMGVKVSYI